MRIAFIGLGVMGGPIARNIARKVGGLSIFDVSEQAMRSFDGLGCRQSASPADAARDADVVVTMLPDSPHVEAALFAEGGVCESLRKGALVVDLSTIGAAASMMIGDRLIAAGLRMVDAPVGRTPRDAEAGTSLLMVGASKEEFEEALPIFRCFADEIIHVGPRGSGLKLKLVNNYMSTVGTLLTAEALTLANKIGLDRAITVKVLSNTTAGRGQLLVNYPKKVLAGDVSADFPLRMARKDVGHALNLGSEVGSPLLLGAIAKEMFGLAQPWGRDGEDWTAMLLLLEDVAKADHLPPCAVEPKEPQL